MSRSKKATIYLVVGLAVSVVFAALGSSETTNTSHGFIISTSQESADDYRMLEIERKISDIDRSTDKIIEQQKFIIEKVRELENSSGK